MVADAEYVSLLYGFIYCVGLIFVSILYLVCFDLYSLAFSCFSKGVRPAYAAVSGIKRYTYMSSSYVCTGATGVPV